MTNMQQQDRPTTQQAKESASSVASSVKDEMGTVVDEGKRQAARVTDDVRQQVSTRVDQQRGQAASALRTSGDELGSIHTDGQSALTQQIVKLSSEKLRDAAGYLETHGPSEVLDGVRDFARRKPMMFLLAAGLAGVVAGRVFRSTVAVRSEDRPMPEATYPQRDQSEYIYAEHSVPVYSDAPIDITDPIVERAESGMGTGRG
jgi:hypothetical protein